MARNTYRSSGISHLFNMPFFCAEAGDGVPGLAVDVYGAYAQVQFYSDYWRPFLPEVYEGLQKIGVKGAYLKKRLRGTFMKGI